MLPSFEQRGVLTEHMDAPDCDPERLIRTVRQFAAINRMVSRYQRILRSYVLKRMAAEPDRDYHLVDLGAGGCDIDCWLLRQASRRGLRLRISAWDADARIVAYAREQTRNIAGLTVYHRDALRDVGDESVDFVYGNHFLHHLRDHEILELLRTWTPRVQCSLLFSDLSRSPLSYFGYLVFSQFFRGSFARADGLRSILRGFRVDELRVLAAQSSQGGGAQIRSYFPGRILLHISRELPSPVNADKSTIGPPLPGSSQPKEFSRF